mgnify:FL=1
MGEIPRVEVTSWQQGRFEEVGRGGEAVVYRLKPGLVAKVFHTPGCDELVGQEPLQEAAKVRIADMQQKLFKIPDGLPENVVQPSAVLVIPSGIVMGYIMPFVDGYTIDAMTSPQAHLPQGYALEVLGKMHDTISALHQKGMVVGDLNEFNVIVSRKGAVPHFIEIDSMQYAGFLCRAFTPRFTAPEIIGTVNPNRAGKYGRAILKGIGRVTAHILRKLFLKRLAGNIYHWAVTPPLGAQFCLVAPHAELTDWYSFMVIAMRMLTYTDPYAGTIDGMDLPQRIMGRVTVFDKSVKYPATARPLNQIPAPFHDAFKRMFVDGERFVPDRNLFGSVESPVPQARADRTPVAARGQTETQPKEKVA